MFSTLLVVLPIFAIILAGWVARRLGVLGPHATFELNRFVVYLALPALLFDVVAHSKPEEIWLPGFIATFALASIGSFALILAWRLVRKHPLPDAAIDALNVGYGNTGYMGFPLALVAFGREALAPTTIATIMTVCGVFALAIVLIEIGLQAQARRGALGLKVARTLIRNPLIVAPFLGALFPVFGLSLPAPAETFLKLLGEAAAPCALVALGLFLAESRESKEEDSGLIAALVAVKLLFQPLVAFLLAAYVFQLTPIETHTAVLIAALPTGTGSFMLAEFYKREAGTTAKIILISTVISVATLTAYLWTVR